MSSSLGNARQERSQYPAQPITFIAANSAGTPVDIVARIVGQEMSKLLGQPVIVENKPGEGHRVGYEYVAKQAPADGYTMACVIVPTLATLPLVVKDLQFDPIKDLPPVIGLAESRFVFGSSARLPWKTFHELVAYAKSNPGKLKCGSPTANLRLSMEALIRDLGLDVIHVPYSGTGAAYLEELGAGDFHMGFVAEAQAISFGNQFQVLAVTGAQRATALADAPTFIDLGFPGVRGLGFSLNVRGGTDQVVLDKLHAAAAYTLQQSDVRALLTGKYHFEIAGGTPEAAARELTEQAMYFAEIAKKLDIQPQ